MPRYNKDSSKLNRHITGQWIRSSPSPRALTFDFGKLNFFLGGGVLEDFPLFRNLSEIAYHKASLTQAFYHL